MSINKEGDGQRIAGALAHLSGMLDTLEARLAQTHAGDPGHVESLQALCEDELARRDAAGIERRLRQARFQQTWVIEDFRLHLQSLMPTSALRFVTELDRLAEPAFCDRTCVGIMKRDDPL